MTTAIRCLLGVLFTPVVAAQSEREIPSCDQSVPNLNSIENLGILECHRGSWRTHTTFVIDVSGRVQEPETIVTESESEGAKRCALGWTQLVLRATYFEKRPTACRYGVEVWTYDSGIKIAYRR